MQSRRRTWTPLVVVVGLAGLQGCSLFGDEAEPVPTVEVEILQAPVAATTFCDRMLAIRDRALLGETVDTDTLVSDYQAAAEVAPEEIRDDLDATIADIEGGVASTEPEDTPDTTLEVVGDGAWTPAATPSARLADYVDTHCAGISANPGPAATPPE